MKDINYAPVCGIYCGECPHLRQQCKGCGYVEGKPFWTAQMPGRICPLHNCCTNEKKLEHCGLCADFPCKTFLELRDPGMTVDEFQKSLEMRKHNLHGRKQIGTEQWLVEKAGC
jgi:hypothetical protein